MPFILSAQLMDTAVVFYENFDGPTIKMTSTTNQSTGLPHWDVESSLFQSASSSYHVTLQATMSNLACWTRAIEVDRSYPYVYLQFDHICKVNNNDNSYISYQVSTGMSPQGDIVFGSWQTLNAFTTTTPYYHGHAESITAGNVSQNWYSVWMPNVDNATPNNTWWKRNCLT